MKISELLKQDDVSVADGNYLASNTRSEGYVPTHRDTQSIALGRYLFKVVAQGAADAVTGYHIVPMVINEDNTEFVPDLANPVAVSDGNVVKYMTGRNTPDYKDGYHGRKFHIVEDIAEGEEARNLLAGFIEFVKSEYSMGVNDFTLEGSDYLESL